MREKCDRIQQENVTLKTRSTEFRVAINKLQGENRVIKERCDRLQQEDIMLKTKSTEFRVAISKLLA